jgi:hypothetical protein
VSVIVGTVPSLAVRLERDTLAEWLYQAEADLASSGIEVRASGRRADAHVVSWLENPDASEGPDNVRHSVTLTPANVMAAAIRVAFEDVEGLWQGADCKADLRACLLSDGEDDNTDVEAYSAVLQTAIWGEVRIS